MSERLLCLRYTVSTKRTEPGILKCLPWKEEGRGASCVNVFVRKKGGGGGAEGPRRTKKDQGVGWCRAKSRGWAGITEDCSETFLHWQRSVCLFVRLHMWMCVWWISWLMTKGVCRRERFRETRFRPQILTVCVQHWRKCQESISATVLTASLAAHCLWVWGGGTQSKHQDNLPIRFRGRLSSDKTMGLHEREGMSAMGGGRLTQTRTLRSLGETQREKGARGRGTRSSWSCVHPNQHPHLHPHPSLHPRPPRWLTHLPNELIWA